MAHTDHSHNDTDNADSCCGPGYASPQEAMNAEREKILYTVALYGGTGVQAPDYLATIDVDPNSTTYSQVIHRMPMPSIGDELHHFGWNACSTLPHRASSRAATWSSRGLLRPHPHRRYRRRPRRRKLHKVIEPEEIAAKTKLTAPHTVHCLADGTS